MNYDTLQQKYNKKGDLGSFSYPTNVRVLNVATTIGFEQCNLYLRNGMTIDIQDHDYMNLPETRGQFLSYASSQCLVLYKKLTNCSAR